MTDGSFDRRGDERPRLARLVFGPFFNLLRLARTHALSLRTTVGLFVLVGGLLALAGTATFATLAAHVRSGGTQIFDDAVLTWMGQHRSPVVEQAMLEITFLGTFLVVAVVVVVAATFLWLTGHRYSAALLLVATGGEIVLNNVLKLGFARPRPQIFTWGTQALSSSFPSGHAMSAAVVYGTIAYLAARLQRRVWSRVLTFVVAGLLILLVCASRLYLGVHYPSDVAAGVVVGLGWAGFCMATLEATQRARGRRVARAE